MDQKPQTKPTEPIVQKKHSALRKRKPTKKQLEAQLQRERLRKKRIVLGLSIGIPSFLLLTAIIIFFSLWWRGLLPTREELPRFKNRIILFFEGYKKAQLPEGDVFGLDISHYQGDVNFGELSFHIDNQRRLYKHSTDKTKSLPVDFVIAKATQGAKIQDSYYKLHKQGARENNVLFGAYHFYSYNVSATAQADNFLHTACLQKGDIAPILDVEPYQNRLPERDSVLKWLNIVEKYYDVCPIIYTGENCYRSYFANQKAFSKYAFWIARYGDKEPSHYHIMWQFTENGKAEGVSGPVDINVFRGTIHDLKYKYTIK